MKIYLVGGAVRDQLLGLPVKEKDWVVVGATVNDMLKKGFRQVGKDFPVFLHPETNEEYALARTERKIGPGYTGFDFNAASTVTLEEDLARRDLTINAMAQTLDGVLCDPYQGKADLDKKILRHVSPAFSEDPVRILRIARFAARFAYLNFKVASDTMALMKNMVMSGEVDALVAERVWKELERALQEKNPEEFFNVLSECGALSLLFPAIKINGFGITALKATLSEPDIRFAVLTHDLLPEQINAICQRYRVPSAYRELALLVAQLYPHYLRADQLTPPELLNFLQKADAFRRPARLEKILNAADSLAKVSAHPLQSSWLLKVYQAAKAVDVKAALNQSLSGPEIAEFLHKKRLEAIAQVCGIIPF